MTILDPTCGSGAFLFAALNILEPLYEACLDRMEAFVAELALAKNTDGNSPIFVSSVERVAVAHPSRRYFIFKHHPEQSLRRGHHGGGRGNL